MCEQNQFLRQNNVFKTDFLHTLTRFIQFYYERVVAVRVTFSSIRPSWYFFVIFVEQKLHSIFLVYTSFSLFYQ